MIFNEEQRHTEERNNNIEPTKVKVDNDYCIDLNEFNTKGKEDLQKVIVSQLFTLIKTGIRQCIEDNSGDTVAQNIDDINDNLKGFIEQKASSQSTLFLKQNIGKIKNIENIEKSKSFNVKAEFENREKILAGLLLAINKPNKRKRRKRNDIFIVDEQEFDNDDFYQKLKDFADGNIENIENILKEIKSIYPENDKTINQVYDKILNIFNNRHNGLLDDSGNIDFNANNYNLALNTIEEMEKRYSSIADSDIKKIEYGNQYYDINTFQISNFDKKQNYDISQKKAEEVNAKLKIPNNKITHKQNNESYYNFFLKQFKNLLNDTTAYPIQLTPIGAKIKTALHNKYGDIIQNDNQPFTAEEFDFLTERLDGDLFTEAITFYNKDKAGNAKIPDPGSDNEKKSYNDFLSLKEVISEEQNINKKYFISKTANLKNYGELTIDKMKKYTIEGTDKNTGKKVVFSKPLGYTIIFAPYKKKAECILKSGKKLKGTINNNMFISDNREIRCELEGTYIDNEKSKEETIKYIKDRHKLHHSKDVYERTAIDTRYVEGKKIDNIGNVIYFKCLVPTDNNIEIKSASKHNNIQRRFELFKLDEKIDLTEEMNEILEFVDKEFKDLTTNNDFRNKINELSDFIEENFNTHYEGNEFITNDKNNFNEKEAKLFYGKLFVGEIIKRIKKLPANNNNINGENRKEIMQFYLNFGTKNEEIDVSFVPEVLEDIINKRKHNNISKKSEKEMYEGIAKKIEEERKNGDYLTAIANHLENQRRQEMINGYNNPENHNNELNFTGNVINLKIDNIVNYIRNPMKFKKLLDDSKKPKRVELTAGEKFRDFFVNIFGFLFGVKTNEEEKEEKYHKEFKEFREKQNNIIEYNKNIQNKIDLAYNEAMEIKNNIKNIPYRKIKKNKEENDEEIEYNGKQLCAIFNAWLQKNKKQNKNDIRIKKIKPLTSKDCAPIELPKKKKNRDAENSLSETRSEKNSISFSD